MQVPAADLKAQYQSIKPEIDAAIQDVLEHTSFILGRHVTDFESAFALAHGVKHCVALGSGTDALHLALWALEIGRGDEVITVPFTFIATVAAISLSGATPVFVDIDPDTYTMDPAALERAITPATKAILPVHLYGHPAPMESIKSIADTHGIPIIEDAAQSHLATWAGRPVGDFSAISCFSFYPGKNLGAYGEAGASLTNDDGLALRMRQLRDHGQVAKYRHAMVGHNYRMDGIQGAVLGVKLKYLEAWTHRRRAIAKRYDDALSGIAGLKLPVERPEACHVYHLYVVRTDRRDSFQKFLTDAGISAGTHYPIPLHFQDAYAHLGYASGSFPVSEAVAKECLSLPLYAEMSDEQTAYVIDKVREFFQP